MFTRRHQQELAEIKGLVQELNRRVPEGLVELERIEEAQDEALRRANAEPLLAFVHIPKTAGATVTSMFTTAYSREAVQDAGNYIRNPDKARAKFDRDRRGWRVTAGHVPYGLFRDHLPPDTRYITFLREPVDRVLSHYYRHIHRQVQRSPKRTRHRLEMGKLRPDAKANTLEEALVEMRMPQINNLATRFLSGHPSPPMEGELPPSALDDAKASLREFAFIGIQERFEESLVLLQRMLALDSLPYRDRHVSSGGGRPAVEEIPDEQRALIEEHNALDAELYRFGLELFDDAVAAADEGFADDVEALRAQDAEAREQEWHEARAANN